VIALTRSVALEYGPLGIRANAICPGPIATPQMLAYLQTLPGGPASYGGHIPLRRLGLPEEIANAAVFLASDEASYVSGAVIPVDGAVSAVLAGG
jgi:NAD(P)-dependent dehydrogenase (short-subunit alcohol dehydrogenase family)